MTARTTHCEIKTIRTLPIHRLQESEKWRWNFAMSRLDLRHNACAGKQEHN